MSTSAGIVGAAVGCGCALLIIIGFIIFRHKVRRNEASCWGFFSKEKHEFGSKKKVETYLQKSPTSSSNWSVSGTYSGVSKKSHLGTSKISPVQPELPSFSSCSIGVPNDRESLYLSQTLYPLDYHRKLSSSTGYSSHSNDTCRSEVYFTNVKLQYRIYYDLDNAQLILHILEARLTTFNSDGEAISASSPERQKYRDTSVTFEMTSETGERQCGRTKSARVSAAGSANYGEIFALPANFESLMDQHIHFDVLCYNSYSRSSSLGTAKISLASQPLDNTDIWIELDSKAGCSSSPLNTECILPPVAGNNRDLMGGPRPEVLVFLSYYIPREELQVDILKVKNIGSLWSMAVEDTTDIYIKTCLVVDDKQDPANLMKHKRRSNQREFSPTTNGTVVFNESLNFPVAYRQLELCVLLVYIIERLTSKRERIIAKCTVGPLGGPSKEGYLQWQNHGNAQLIRSNAMWHPLHPYSGSGKSKLAET